MLLFLLFFSGVYALLQILVRRRTARSRLLHVKERKLDIRVAGWLSQFRRVYGHLHLLLEASHAKLGLGWFIVLTVMMLLLGIACGALFFQTVKGIVVLASMLGGLPYVWLRIHLISLRLRNRMEFLPAVEVLYQFYQVSGGKNVKQALQVCLEENRIVYPIKPVFEQLHRRLLTSRDMDESMRLFVISHGHIWAEYLSGMLRVALTEGTDITDNLKDLIQDMRRAQRTDQAERNRLLEIRIANFTPLAFLALFIFINVKMNSSNAYLYYVLDPEGRNLILDALMLIFASFLMGIYLSMKRM
ncbi:hypothetical protein SD70_23690 [Gordoniibacillus kamchatkensis]|uniref:Type II secretion system protein GspF domain-containing protein n=2 Tax=Gordoniibacillus kamchatkensis TaxID=1590651 RepID=A0ABR5ADH5_9BACL|nr:hypothetical protein SD70_23690 [Paenibacillus sp. VKM B-2647]